MEATKFLKSVSELQNASGEAKALPSGSALAAFALAELIKLGFLVEHATEHKQAKVPAHVKKWATDANVWAVKMHNTYKVPNVEVKATHLNELKEWKTEGIKILPDKHKGLKYLEKVKTS